MIRETYVLRGGKLVPKRQTTSRDGPAVISDTMPDTWHPADGRHYDSKSRFRAETRARGLIEVGNERQKDTRQPFAGSAYADTARAVEMVRQGYRPKVLREGE